VLPQPKEWDGRDIARLSRRELIARLLESDETSSFQFSAAWLHKQWTRRLRSLLLANRRQRPALSPGLDQEGLDRPQPEALVGPLRQANRRRRGLTPGALAALVAALAGWAVTAAVQVRTAWAAREAAGQARREARRARRDRQQAQEGARHEALADARREDGKP
jgi:hypothetical protein